MKLLPNNQIKKKLLIGLALAAFLSLTGSALAQEVQRTYTVINPQIDVKLDPGKTSEGTTQVINETNVPLTFNLVIQDYVVNDTKGTPTFLPPNTLNSKYSAASWIGVDQNTFTLKPQEARKINYYISVPANAKPGGHYAGIVYAPQVTPQKGTGGVVYTQIGSLFYITVNGPVKENAVVSKLFANPFQEFGPVKIATQIKNLGDLHIKPKGKINISGLFNNSSYNLAEYNIFPETARDYENYVNQWFMLGRYKAELAASYGANNLPISATVYFWVFPWRIIILVILIIIATVLGVKYYKKRKKGVSGGIHEAKNEAIEAADKKDAISEEAPKE